MPQLTVLYFCVHVVAGLYMQIDIVLELNLLVA